MIIEEQKYGYSTKDNRSTQVEVWQSAPLAANGSGIAEGG